MSRLVAIALESLKLGALKKGTGHTRGGSTATVTGSPGDRYSVKIQLDYVAKLKIAAARAHHSLFPVSESDV
jgi:hypothetical protein